MKTAMGEATIKDNPNNIYAFVSVVGGYQSDLSGHLSHGSDFNVTAYQEISAIPEGIYTLSAIVKSSGNQDVLQMFIRGHGGAEMICDIVKTDTWTKISIENISISSGQCVIGFYSDSHANEWLYFDNIELEKKK